jgi:DNA polymerase-3 subunit chi
LGIVNFYHLTRHGMDEVIDMLVPKALDRGMRVMIRSPDRASLERQDSRLWLQPEDGFLPHGLEGGPHDVDQPVLLGSGAPVNGAQAVFLMGAQEVDVAEAAGMQRVWLAFEGGDDAQVQAARVQWKAVAAAGLEAQYWNDESGRWEKKAESAAKV